MSTTEGVKIITLPAGENLKDQLYELLKLNSSGQVVRTEAETDTPIGIMAQSSARDIAVGDPVTVMDIAAGGIGLVKAGEAITVGQLLSAHSTDGHVQGDDNLSAMNSNEIAIGIALDAASASGEIIRVKLGLYGTES